MKVSSFSISERELSNYKFQRWGTLWRPSSSPCLEIVMILCYYYLYTRKPLPFVITLSNSQLRGDLRPFLINIFKAHIHLLHVRLCVHWELLLRERVRVVKHFTLFLQLQTHARTYPHDHRHHHDHQRGKSCAFTWRQLKWSSISIYTSNSLMTLEPYMVKVVLQYFMALSVHNDICGK